MGDQMSKPKALLKTLLGPFYSQGSLDFSLVVLFLAINGLVFINGFIHAPRICYDSESHHNYIRTLSKMTLPGYEDSHQFFSPPLPYVIPALYLGLAGEGPGRRIFQAGKVAQLMNFLMSVGLTFFLIKTCRLISDDRYLCLGALLLLGMLPVYYRTFAYIRGEPYVAFFYMAALYYLVRFLVRKEAPLFSSAAMGLAMGLAAFSRQWAVLLFPAVFVFTAYQFIRYPDWRGKIIKYLVPALLAGSLIGSGYYVYLKARHGSFTAFNRESAAGFSLSNQPPEFYFGVSPGPLFTKPVRPNFANQLLPIFYSELWGDYWGYFIVSGKDSRNGSYFPGARCCIMIDEGDRPLWMQTNYDSVVPYLGRVNLVSLFPTLLALAAMAFCAVSILRKSPGEPFDTRTKEVAGFMLLAIFFAAAGYFWFLVMYPNLGQGDTIKATYLIQVYPYVAIMTGCLLARIRAGSKLTYRLVLAGLVLVTAHNLPAMVSHYSLLHRLF